MFPSFMGKFKILSKSPFTLFVYSILGKWYITIFLTAIVVAFWVFKGLGASGVLQKAESTVFEALRQTKSVAQHCVPLITDLGRFWNCLENPPRYVPSKEEEEIEKGFGRSSKKPDYDIKDPYD